MKERIAKRIARAGLTSRRSAEVWIANGRVSINGEVIDTPAIKVGEKDIICVDGNTIPDAPDTALWLYHKPQGQITSHHDPEGRLCVFDVLPEAMGHVVSVGRLDLNSEGLLLLTNNGELARYLELPATGWLRTYRIRVKGMPDAEAITALKRGITVDGVHYGSIRVRAETERGGQNQWLTVSLSEGKNRELRRVFEHIGHPVSRLIRVSYGPFQLGKLPPEELKPVPRGALKNALGKGFEI